MHTRVSSGQFTPWSCTSGYKWSQGVVAMPLLYLTVLFSHTHARTHANTFLNQTVLDGDQGRMWRLACAAGRREGGREASAHLPVRLLMLLLLLFQLLVHIHDPLLQCERPAHVRWRRGEGTEKDRARVVAGGGEAKRRRRKRGIAKEDRGPLAADAVDLLLCSIHGVMADSSWSSLSRNSCQRWACPLQVVRRGSVQQRAPSLKKTIHNYFT